MSDVDTEECPVSSDRDALDAFRNARTTAEKRRAFETLYQQHASSVFKRVLLPVLADETLAEEALSVTFRKVIEKLDRFEDRGAELSSWIARVAKNTAIDLLRSEKRVRDRHASFASAVTTMVASMETPETWALDVDKQRQQRAEIERTLEKLHERYADAIRMRFFEDKSRAECAKALGVKVATFDVILLRSLRAFRKQWEAMTNAESEHHG